jgi:hypothetical protein
VSLSDKRSFTMLCVWSKKNFNNPPYGHYCLLTLIIAEPTTEIIQTSKNKGLKKQLKFTHWKKF